MDKTQRIGTYILAFALGGLLSAAAVVSIVSNQVQAGTAAVDGSIHTLQANAIQREGILQQTVDAWQARAQKCEAQFSNATVIYEKQDLASIPVLNGAAVISVGGAVAQPSLYIPAQVEVFTNRQDVRYEWRNAKTGESQGLQLPKPLPAVPQ